MKRSIGESVQLPSPGRTSLRDGRHMALRTCRCRGSECLCAEDRDGALKLEAVPHPLSIDRVRYRHRRWVLGAPARHPGKARIGHSNVHAAQRNAVARRPLRGLSKYHASSPGYLRVHMPYVRSLHRLHRLLVRPDVRFGIICGQHLRCGPRLERVPAGRVLDAAAFTHHVPDADGAVPASR